LVTPSAENGIRKEYLIRTSKIATLDKTLAKGLLGKLSQEQVVEMNKNLVKLFGLS
jgi:mRNA interferase MazF